MSQDNQPWTIRRLLDWTTPFFTRREVDSPRLSAELLLSHVVAAPRIKLYTNFDQLLTEPQLAQFRDLVKRAGEHEPIAYLTGKAHFFGLEFDVTRDVLIPRPDTETLVEHVVQLARNQAGFESARMLDLCTGSGCIAAAIASRLKAAAVVATDISDKAVEIARKNIERLGFGDRVMVEQGDLFHALANVVDRRPFDLILANPPYIASAKIASLDRNVRDFEPVLALDGGEDGLTFHRRILQGATKHLRAGGRIYLEIAFNQRDAALALVDASHFADARVVKDHAGNDRILTATRTANP